MQTRLWWFRVFNAVASVVTVLFLFGVLKSQPVYFVQANSAVKCVLAGWLPSSTATLVLSLVPTFCCPPSPNT